MAQNPKVNKYSVFFALLNTLHPNEWVAEHRFHPKRLWRLDFANPYRQIAVEIDGGIWSGGRHTRGSGYVKDLEKFNEATVRGWRVLKYTPSQLYEVETTQQICSLADLTGITIAEPENALDASGRAKRGDKKRADGQPGRG